MAIFDGNQSRQEQGRGFGSTGPLDCVSGRERDNSISHDE